MPIMDKYNNERDYLLGQYEKSVPPQLSWNEKLILSKEFKFDYLEMSIDESPMRLKRLDLDPDFLKEVKSAINKSGQGIKSICLSGHRRFPLGSRHKEIQNISLKIMERTIYLASEIGARVIQLAGYDVYYEESHEDTEKIFLENLNKCVNMGAKYGVNLGFETMETPFMDTVKKAMNYVNKIKSPYLGVYPDIGNLKNSSLIYNHSVNEDLYLGGGRIFAAHIKETLPNRYREVEFGEGHTEFKSSIRALKDMGVRMFTCEFWYTGNEDWRYKCIRSHNFVREKLDEVFRE